MATIQDEFPYIKNLVETHLQTCQFAFSHDSVHDLLNIHFYTYNNNSVEYDTLFDPRVAVLSVWWLAYLFVRRVRQMRWIVFPRLSLSSISFNEYAKQRFISCCVSRTNEIASERWTVTAYISHFSRTVLQLGTRARIQHKHWINSSLQASCLGRFMNTRLVCSPDGDTCTFTSTVRQQLSPSCQLHWINCVSASCWLFPSLFNLSLLVKYTSPQLHLKLSIRLILEYAIYNTWFNNGSVTFITVIHSFT